MTTAIKFCGITRSQDAEMATMLGVRYLGFVLVPSSPRFISAQAAHDIICTLPSPVQAVALFQNADEHTVQQAIAVMRPHILQFHGRETPEFCQQFGLPYIKAVPMGQPQVLTDWHLRYATSQALLLDSHTDIGGGGSGHRFNWQDIGANTGAKPLFLAGGLTPDNVQAAVMGLRPYAVDVSSGIEAAKGIKDSLRMRAFVDAVAHADAAIAATH